MNYRKIDLEKDRELILKFRKDVNRISLGNAASFDEETYLRRLKERIKAFPDGQLFVEENGITIGQIGFFTTEFEGERIGYVNLLYIAPEYRGTGIGQSLIQHMEDFFRRCNLTEYHLRVSPTNKRAYDFYVKMGMVKLMEEDVGRVAWRMKKQL